MSGEKKLWDYVGPKLKHYGHFERIESHETAIGTPDVNYCIKGYCNHLELKYTENEKKCILRPAQCNWFRMRVKAGGQPWLLLHAFIRDTRGYALIPGTNVPQLANTKDARDWLNAAVMIWEGKIDISQLVEFIGTYLIVEEPDGGGIQSREPSGLILPSGVRRN